MMWKGLGLVTNTESPIVVVLRYILAYGLPRQHFQLTALVHSGSMEPAFYRGDLLFLTNPVNEPYMVGDITVYKVGPDTGLHGRSRRSTHALSRYLERRFLSYIA
jgi:signal peptidase I